MKSVNKVTLLGCLGHDPEIKDAGTHKIAKLSIATNSNVMDDAGQWQERVEWHHVVLWDRLADIAEQYLKKGSRVYVEGRLRTSSWEDKKTGEKKYRTEIIGGQLVMLGDAQRTNGRADSPVSAEGQTSTAESVEGTPF